MIVYCDGIFDLLHWGHIQHFKQAKNLFENVYLIVGVNNDFDSTDYKRLPIVNEDLRYKMVESIKYVDKVIFPAPMIMTEYFIKKHGIDLIVHGMKTEAEFESQDIYHQIPKKLGIFKRLPYSEGISTTDIIENKPKLITNYVSKNYIDLSNKIIKKLHLNLNEKPLRILQIGANNGKLLYLINKELNFKLDCWGVEKDSELVYQSYNNLFNIKSKIINVDSYQNLPFKDEFFDCVFYDQENSEIDRNMIEEMLRVTNNKIFIDNIKNPMSFHNNLWIVDKNNDNNYSALFID
jgi:cytidyltransferase-like protein